MPFGIAAAAGATALGASAGTAALVGAGGALVGKLATSAIGSGQQSSQVAAGQQQAQNFLAPYVGTGTNALGVVGDLSGANGPDAATAAMKNFYTDPGYQFQLQQGERGVDAGAAAAGMLRSGATLKAEDTFAQGVASQDFSNYYNRLYNLANMGQNSSAGAATSATNAATQQANITGNLYGGINNATSSLMSNPAVTSGINNLFAPATPVPQQMTGFAPAMQPGQAGVGGFVAPAAPAVGY